MAASDNHARAWGLLDETACIARLKELRWPSGHIVPTAATGGSTTSTTRGCLFVAAARAPFR
jgi:hypothetical protein